MRLIDADALREALGITGTADTCEGCAYNNNQFTSCNLIKAPSFTYVCEAIDDAPTADDWQKYSDALWKEAYERGKSDAVRHGRWKPLYSELNLYVCSECDGISVGETNFCHHCGAQMDNTQSLSEFK